MLKTAPQISSPSAAPARCSGQVTYIFAFDLAYELARVPLTQLLGQPLTQFQPDIHKRAPRGLFFHRPMVVRLPAEQRELSGGSVAIERQIKVFSIGAISISVQVPFEVASVDELVMYHDLAFKNGTTLHDEVLALAEQVRRELHPHLIRPVERLAEEEAYTIFCITSPLPATGDLPTPAEEWLKANRRSVAALLVEENDATHLSDQEAEESTSRYLSYYDRDLAVIDWDAALIIDEPKFIDEMVYLMELANLQLAELEACDRLLDTVLEGAYRDLSANASLRGMRRGKSRKTLNELRELRIDLARFSDELSNITKFFGDWHLARTYQALAGRFHLADWHKTTDEKLKTLGELYQLLQTDRNNRWMLVLEVTIVLLFIIDLAMLFRGMH